MNKDIQKAPVEIEVKYLGGEEEFASIVGWLEENGFAATKKPLVHRIHVYFDDNSKLRNFGARLRCVIAPGEWCRYDFKVEDPTGRGETTEVSVKKAHPIPLSDAVNELADSLPDGLSKSALLGAAASAAIVLAMPGTHEKAVLGRDGLEVEVSRDLLIPLGTGVPLAEVEVELLAGTRGAFDACIEHLETSLHLTRTHGNKLERALGNSEK